MNGARILVGCELIALAVDDYGFFELRQQQDTASGGRGGGRQQPVIAASVQADQRRRGEAAQAVGFQPFPRERQIQSGADALIEANQVWFHSRTPLRSATTGHTFTDSFPSDRLLENRTMFNEYSAGNSRDERLTLPKARSRAGSWVEARMDRSRTIAYTLSRKLGDDEPWDSEEANLRLP